MPKSLKQLTISLVVDIFPKLFHSIFFHTRKLFFQILVASSETFIEITINFRIFFIIIFLNVFLVRKYILILQTVRDVFTLMAKNHFFLSAFLPYKNFPIIAFFDVRRLRCECVGVFLSFILPVIWGKFHCMWNVNGGLCFGFWRDVLFLF